MCVCVYVCVCIGNIIDTLNFYVIYVVYAYVCVCMCTLCMCVHVYICMCVHDQVHVPQLLELSCEKKSKYASHAKPFKSSLQILLPEQ